MCPNANTTASSGWLVAVQWEYDRCRIRAADIRRLQPEAISQQLCLGSRLKGDCMLSFHGICQSTLVYVEMKVILGQTNVGFANVGRIISFVFLQLLTRYYIQRC